MDVKIKKIDPRATIPTYATDGSNAFDLYAIEGCGYLSEGDTYVFDTGIAFEIPEGHGMLVLSRSGHGFNYNVRLANCVGLIDSDFRDSVKVKLTKDDVPRPGLGIKSSDVKINDGARVAQAIILPIPKINFIEVQELSETARGTGGFGSTGA